jgi:hypothetical protein
MHPATIVGLFIATAFAEIGGRYLTFRWQRRGGSSLLLTGAVTAFARTPAGGASVVPGCADRLVGHDAAQGTCRRAPPGPSRAPGTTGALRCRTRASAFADDGLIAGSWRALSDAGEPPDADAVSQSVSDGAIADATDLRADAAEAASELDAATANSDACAPSSLPISTQCSRDSDCTFAFRDGCCGGAYYGLGQTSAVADGVNRGCTAPLMCGALGCANISHADDQREVHAARDVRVSCIQNTCRTWVKAASFPCGVDSCNADQYCELFGSGTSNRWRSWALRVC